jgi:hypothetical protein
MISRTEAPSGIDARLRMSIVAVAVCGGGLTMLALIVMGPRIARSVAVGAALAAGNLWVLARVVTALLPNSEKGSHHADLSGSLSGASAWVFLAIFKMCALFTVVWLLMRYAVVSPLSMLIGFGALPLGIAIGSLLSDRNASQAP